MDADAIDEIDGVCDEAAEETESERETARTPCESCSNLERDDKSHGTTRPPSVVAPRGPAAWWATPSRSTDASGCACFAASVGSAASAGVR
eukprot:scaffold253977_cov27-Tisochrysis_lutea.AAC.3